MITGPTIGAEGLEYEYNFETTDPEGEDVFYYVEWGDETSSGWVGPYSSGIGITLNHTWTIPDVYEIRAKAKDTKGKESAWTTLEVSMPKNKTINRLILNFLEQEPNLFPIIRQLLGL